MILGLILFISHLIHVIIKKPSFSRAIDKNNCEYIKSQGELLFSLPKIRSISPMGLIRELSSFLNEVLSFPSHQL